MFKHILLAMSAIALLAFDTPTGWFRAGSKPNSYDMGVDKGAGQDGKNAATIRSIDKKIKGFGTLMQQIKPAKFLGKRIRMTGYVKSENVANQAALWLRIDQAGSQQPLAFDNMSNRPIKGTTAWTKYEIVVDVPVHASLMAFGALLSGTGQIWFDRIAFEIVEPTIPTTGMQKDNNPLAEPVPVNLDFEQ